MKIEAINLNINEEIVLKRIRQRIEKLHEKHGYMYQDYARYEILSQEVRDIILIPNCIHASVEVHVRPTFYSEKGIDAYLGEAIGQLGEREYHEGEVRRCSGNDCYIWKPRSGAAIRLANKAGYKFIGACLIFAIDKKPVRFFHDFSDDFKKEVVNNWREFLPKHIETYKLNKYW